MGLVVTPVVKGKEQEWKNWVNEMKGDMKKDFDDLNNRYGLTRHDVWAVESPNGLMAVVLHEGPGADTFMQKIATSENKTNLLFKESLGKFHGMDLNAPPPGPMPVKLI